MSTTFIKIRRPKWVLHFQIYQSWSNRAVEVPFFPANSTQWPQSSAVELLGKPCPRLKVTVRRPLASATSRGFNWWKRLVETRGFRLVFWSKKWDNHGGIQCLLVDTAIFVDASRLSAKTSDVQGEVAQPDLYQPIWEHMFQNHNPNFWWLKSLQNIIIYHNILVFFRPTISALYPQASILIILFT